VLAAKNPVAATLERPGAPAPIELALELAGEPVRLGISWRTDDAEPATVIVNRVTPGSAAERAGLRVGDRIYRIGDQEFARGEEFRQRAVSTAGPLSLEVETAGQVRTLEIVPVDLDDEAASGEKPAD
jgi:C-terminal processing protease CtpA/Prc